MSADNATVLIIDDDPAIHSMIGRIVKRHSFTPLSAHGGQDALNKLHAIFPDLILLDLSMPGMDGFEVAERIKNDPRTHHIPILIITGNRGTDLLSRALGSCADDFIVKTADPSEIIARMQYHLKRKRLFERLWEEQVDCRDTVSLTTGQLTVALERLKEASLEIIWRLTAASEHRDNETGEHIKRMSRYAAAIARQMGLKHKTVETLLYAAPLHDIGKIGIPDNILLKPGKLDETEMAIMQSQTTIGAEILAGSKIDLVRMGRVIALTHHEKWDGSGYPQGLKGPKIPLVGRIVALADVFDALTSRRPYKKAYSLEASMRIILDSRGGHFDPRGVDAFLTIEDTIRHIMTRHQENDQTMPAPEISDR